MKVPKYEVEESRLPALEEKLEKLSEKAEVLGGFIRLVYWGKKEHYLSDSEMIYIHTVTIDGFVGSIDGWMIVAKLEYDTTTDQNLVWPLPTWASFEDVPHRFRESGMYCDHCRLSRRRNSVLLIQSEEGELLQVGSTCLKSFFGGRSVSELIGLAELLLEAKKEAEISHDTAVADVPGSARWLALRPYLCKVAAQIEEDGKYHSRTRSGSGEATADRALVRELDSSYLTYVDEALAWLSDTWGYWMAPDDRSDYQHNLVTICSDDYIARHHIGYAASLLPVYHASQNKQTFQVRCDEYFGEIGQKHQIRLRCVWTHWTNGRFSSCLNKFVDETGRIFIWFTSQEFEVDVEYVGEVKIKDHKMFGDEWQTLIYYCKLRRIS